MGRLKNGTAIAGCGVMDTVFQHKTNILTCTASRANYPYVFHTTSELCGKLHRALYMLLINN